MIHRILVALVCALAATRPPPVCVYEDKTFYAPEYLWQRAIDA